MVVFKVIVFSILCLMPDDFTLLGIVNILHTGACLVVLQATQMECFEE